MKVKKFVNCNRSEVISRQFGVFIGVSLINKYFNKKNIREHILWSLSNTRDDVAIVICDQIHAYNFQAIYNCDYETALKRAIDVGRNKFKEIEDVVLSLPMHLKSKIRIVCWHDVSANPRYQDRLGHIYNYYDTSPDFKEQIHDAVRSTLGQKFISKIGTNKIALLAKYLLCEIAAFVGGLDLDGSLYEIHSYPGLSLVDDILTGLNTRAVFPDLAERLDIQTRIGIVEAYADDYIEVKIIVRPSKLGGFGLFARKPIRRDEVVYTIIGHLRENPTRFTIPIDESLYLDPYGFPGQNQNHSCNPNCGIKMRNIVVARCDITEGEEITIDYSMIGYDYGPELPPEDRQCLCGEANCRGSLGCYKELPDDVKMSYTGYISKYLVGKYG